MRVRVLVLVPSLSLALAFGCGEGGTPYAWKLPQGFPAPHVPPDNPLTVEKVALGRHLFYDQRLSGNQTQACASCHEQQRAFADGKPTAMGSTGDPLARNSMGLANVVYSSVYTWANPALESLEKQVLVPMFGEAPVELGMADRIDEILARLRAEPRYRELFRAAFPREADPVLTGRIVQALASFVRTLVSGDSPYDRFYYQDRTEALSPEAQRGADLFFSEKCECYHCHTGINFTASFRTAKSALIEGDVFHNTGLYNLGGTGAYPPRNTGLHDATREPADMGKFRVPTLRNVELTAPYMHDGSIATLEDAIDHYAAGGRTLLSGPHAGVGKDNPHKSPFVRGFVLDADERAALLAFLRSLTDTSFVDDPRFSDPWR